MLKLFRDYLFHMITEDGRPWLDHAHILQCLNKLDAGTTEKVTNFTLAICMWSSSNGHRKFSFISGELNVQRRTVRFSCYVCRIETLFGAVIC